MKTMWQPVKLQYLLPYSWVKTILFGMEPEQSHHFSMKWLNAAYRAGLTGSSEPLAGQGVTLAGLYFPNKIGLAAGLDKNGTSINGLGSLGFGFIEVGTVTPKPQPGNPTPRLFRLKNHQAIINRMGFNNNGIEFMVSQLQRRHYTGPLGVNIGKNKATPAASSLDDYIITMTQVFAHCDYLTVNISSPNTKGLRDLQDRGLLSDFLAQLKQAYSALEFQYKCSPPLFLKVAPDLNQTHIEDIATLVQQHALDGLVVSNTTLARTGVEQHIYGNQAGGLSGAPLREQSTQVLTLFRQAVGPDFPIIGVGGIFSVADAQAKLAAGADLVQIYTGFIYEGPALIRDLTQNL